MHHSPTRQGRRAARPAFAAPDAITLTAGLALAAVIGLPALQCFRTEARLAGSADNLRQLGKAHAAYSADNEDFTATFDLQYVPPNNGGFGGGPMYYDIGGGFEISVIDNLEAGVAQLAGIVRRRTGRIGGGNGIRTLNQLLAHGRYDHQMLLDYLDGDPASPLFASPLDVNQQGFQSLTHVDEYSELPGGDPSFVPADSRWTDEANVAYWPYESSYTPTAYIYTPSRPDDSGELASAPYELDGTLSYNNDIDRIGPQRRDGVMFPSLKALLFEEFDYRNGAGPDALRYANDAASTNNLAFDGSVRFLATTEVNPGWDPNNFTDMSEHAEITYRSIDLRYFPDERGNGSHQPEFYPGRQRWTRGGLEGIDFGAGEINTSDW